MGAELTREELVAAVTEVLTTYEDKDPDLYELKKMAAANQEYTLYYDSKPTLRITVVEDKTSSYIFINVLDIQGAVHRLSVRHLSYSDVRDLFSIIVDYFLTM